MNMEFCAKRFDELSVDELYEKLGFKVVSDEYPEEGIMHVDMEIRL